MASAKSAETEHVEHATLAAALAAFQEEAPTLYKSAEAKAGSYSYRYVDLADVVEAIRPLMGKHGLSFSSFPCLTADGKPGLRYVLRHASGDVESDVMSLMLSKADAQAHGSAITYARRYALCAVLNIVADADDDGAAAKAAAERAQANGNGSAPEPELLGDTAVDAVLTAIASAKMGTSWLRARLVAIGAPDVPEGAITKGTIQRLSGDQALELVRLCEKAAEEKAAKS